MTKYKYTCNFVGSQEIEEIVEFDWEMTEDEIIQDCKEWAYSESVLEYNFEKIED